MFNPARGAKNIKKDFIEYVTTALEFPKNPKTGKSEMGDKFKEQLSKVVAKGPFIDLNCIFKKGKTIHELIDEKDLNGKSLLSPLFRELEVEKDKKEGYKRNVNMLELKEIVKYIDMSDDKVAVSIMNKPGMWSSTEIMELQQHLKDKMTPEQAEKYDEIMQKIMNNKAIINGL